VHQSHEESKELIEAATPNRPKGGIEITEYMRKLDYSRTARERLQGDKPAPPQKDHHRTRGGRCTEKLGAEALKSQTMTNIVKRSTLSRKSKAKALARLRRDPHAKKAKTLNYILNVAEPAKRFVNPRDVEHIDVGLIRPVRQLTCVGKRPAGSP
jgi:hypothetical protein